MTTQTIDLALIFYQLQGPWVLHRDLQSTNTAEPSGRCSGVATFTSRKPSVFIDKDCQLQTADAELLYHEQGEFELYQASPGPHTVPRFSFSRKYVWRLQKCTAERPSMVSVWFTKPGTDVVDYLFHNVVIQSNAVDAASNLQTGYCLEGSGCHLCEDDLYSSTYTFQLSGASPAPKTTTEVTSLLQHWVMVHEVRGPGKDQVIETKFSRPTSK